MAHYDRQYRKEQETMNKKIDKDLKKLLKEYKSKSKKGKKKLYKNLCWQTLYKIYSK